MALLRRVEADADDALAIGQRLVQRLHRRLGRKVTQKTEDDLRGDAEFALAVAQGLFDALEDGREGYAAPGVSLRVEEDLRVAHSVLRDAAQVGQGEVVEKIGRASVRERVWQYG